jgi:outer membrane autotransporter protein
MTGASNVLAGRSLRRCVRVCVVAFTLVYVFAHDPAAAAPCLKLGAHGPIVSPLIGISITCNNSNNRSGLVVIDLATTAPLGGFITLNNSGRLSGGVNGMVVQTIGGLSPINITNSGAISSTGTGIVANALFSPITIVNSGDIAAAGLGTFGIFTFAGTGKLSLSNSGDIATAGLGTSGIFANAGTGNLVLQNSGDIATAGAGVFGISAAAGLGNITLKNSGDVAVAGAGVIGISAAAADGKIELENSGNIAAAGAGVFGISAATLDSDVALSNMGGVTVRGDSVRALTASAGDDLNLTNNGNLSAKGDSATGINGSAADDASVTNRGNITVNGKNAFGIAITAAGEIDVNNAARVLVTGNQAIGMSANSASGPVSLSNTGIVDVNGASATGLSATSAGVRQVTINNQGSVDAAGVAIALSAGQDAVVLNGGSAFGGTAGISVQSGNTIKISNAGSVSAANDLAITATGQQINVINSGLVTGSVQLAGQSTFDNQPGGVFEALSSDFGSGVFVNESQAVVHTAHTPGLNEAVTFTGLRSFSNAGTISLVDDDPNDVFELAPFGNNQTYVGKGDGAVAVDVFLGAPGSAADNVIINGNVKGKTELVVNNTNPGNGATNKEGIPVVFVEGNVVGNQFYLKHAPIDAGLVAYDLFFVPTGSGIFELRTLSDGHTGSFLLPELTTASQDVFFATTETWFDRTADLRVLLNGGGTGVQPVSYPTDGDSSPSFNPAIWVRAGGAQLNQGDTAGGVSDGRTYNYNMGRDLQVMNFESGIDMGKRDFLTDGDILVFGVLGGAINAVLDYNQIVRQFSYEGGEVGVYATYMRGGLFVDTLAKADFLTLDPRDARGFPDTLDDNNVGGRVDAGYRFGGFNGGMFVEPLATIAFAYANVEGFTKDGNTVEFEDETNIRGRLGMRLGTSMAAWDGATFEPFVIGSVWSTLGGTNSATLTSLGTTFPTFSDESTDVWGEVSAGVNFFVPNKQTSVFAKVDVSFGEDLDGVGGRAGMRYNW